MCVVPLSVLRQAGNQCAQALSHRLCGYCCCALPLLFPAVAHSSELRPGNALLDALLAIHLIIAQCRIISYVRCPFPAAVTPSQAEYAAW